VQDELRDHAKSCHHNDDLNQAAVQAERKHCRNCRKR
jgi:hypothetical protein